METFPLLRKSLVVGIIFLFVGTCIIPVPAQDTEKLLITSRENWLYVGGSGPGNYTRIQDAIDNASDGDTVFVYNDSSPYVENVEVDTSISLIGEDKNTTIINGTAKGDGVNITADNVTIIGFRIQDCRNGSGISISSNNSRIMDNILSDNIIGIMTNYGNLSIPLTPSKGHNTIINNIIMYCLVGILLEGTRDNTITGNSIISHTVGIALIGAVNNTITRNSISQTEYGIWVDKAANNNISFNSISENGVGVFIRTSYNTLIYRNNFSFNENGVFTWLTSADKILQNNFIGNTVNATSYQALVKIRLLIIELHLPIRRNVWNENYWDSPRALPYKIPGVSRFRFQVDWYPAQEPYDI
jgi:parallel beta-helix repeat protein